jgi:hypothetical protein
MKTYNVILTERRTDEDICNSVMSTFLIPLLHLPGCLEESIQAYVSNGSLAPIPDPELRNDRAFGLASTYQGHRCVRKINGFNTLIV